MQVIDILSERKDDTTSLGNSIVAILKKTPSVKKPLEQFKNDPNKFHSTARSRFRTWATRSGLSYVQTNVMRRGRGGTKRIAMYSFVAMMQKECGVPVTGILDTQSMRAFINNAGKFTDSHISSRVESAIASSSVKVPRGCIDVVQAIENPGKNWGSTYATYHDRNGKLDFGIGPGQVEPATYKETGGSFDFSDLDSIASIDKLTVIMLEAINLKMQYADRIAKKEGKEITTLEDFARAWNYKNYDKAQTVYGDNKPMRDTPSTKPKEKPKTEPKLPDVPKDDIDKAINKALSPDADVQKTEPGYIDKLKTGFGNILRGYLDSDG